VYTLLSRPLRTADRRWTRWLWVLVSALHHRIDASVLVSLIGGLSTDHSAPPGLDTRSFLIVSITRQVVPPAVGLFCLPGLAEYQTPALSDGHGCIIVLLETRKSLFYLHRRSKYLIYYCGIRSDRPLMTVS